MSELSGDARALIEASRSGDEPLAHDKARVKRRLVAELGASAFAVGAFASTTVGGGAAGVSGGATSMGAGGVSGGGAGASASAGASVSAAGAGMGTLTGAKIVGAALWWKALVTGVVAASGAGLLYAGASLVGPTQDARKAPAVATQTATKPPPSSPAASGAEERPEASAAADPGELSGEARVPNIASGPARARVLHRGAGRRAQAEDTTRAQTSVETGSMSAELALLAQAQRALREQRPEEALRLARQHAAAFPDGALAEERAGIETLARCLLGEPSEAAARAFLARAPHSPLAARVRSACGAR